MSIRVSDRAARLIGKATLLAFVGAPMAAFGSLLLVGNDGAHFARWAIGAAIVAITAWTLARGAMAFHLEQHADERAVEGWAWREGTKLGFLVPFTYLLATPTDRRRFGNARTPPGATRRWMGW